MMGFPLGLPLAPPPAASTAPGCEMLVPREKEPLRGKEANSYGNSEFTSSLGKASKSKMVTAWITISPKSGSKKVILET